MNINDFNEKLEEAAKKAPKRELYGPCPECGEPIYNDTGDECPECGADVKYEGSCPECHAVFLGYEPEGECPECGYDPSEPDEEWDEE